MDVTLHLSDSVRTTAAILLLGIVAVESGGLFMARVVRGAVPATPLQRSFFRAGHAHAAVLVTLSLVCLVLLDATALSGAGRVLARSGVPVAAILMPAGFFLSAAGPGRTAPNRLVVLVYLGAASLAAGVVTLAVGLLSVA